MHWMRANGEDLEAHQKLPCICIARAPRHTPRPPKNRNISTRADNMAP